MLQAQPKATVWAALSAGGIKNLCLPDETIVRTINKNEMLPQRKEALDRWAAFVEGLLQENIIPITLKKCV